MVKWLLNNKWLILIIFIATLLRVTRLDYLELFGDEIDAGYQSYSLLTTGKDYMGNQMPVYAQSLSEWRAPGLMYAMMPFIKVFGLNEWGVRLTSAFFGVLGIIAFYLLLKIIGIDKKIGLWSVLLLSINPWHIQYSRAGFELTLLSSLIIWGAYFLVKGIKLKKDIWIIISGLLFSASFYTYNTANIYVPLISFLTLVLFKANKKQILILFFTGLILSIPMAYQILFGHAADRFGSLSILTREEVVAEVNDYRNAGNNSFLAKVFYNKFTVAGKRILFNYTNSFSSNFLFNEGDVTFRHSLHKVGNLFWIELPLIIWGLINIFSKKKTIGIIWLLGLLLLSSIPSSLTYDGYNHASRLFLLVFPLTFLAAFALNNLNKLFKFLAILILLVEFINYQYYYWNFYRNESWRWWHTGYKESMNYIADNKDNYKMVLMDNTYEPALIRFLFWNKINPREVTSINKEVNINVGKFKGFCYKNSYCFVNYEQNFTYENLEVGVLYFISQERVVDPDQDWGKLAPKGMKVLKTVRNFDGKAIFYLVEKESAKLLP